jgi:hypothetical protein
VDLIKLVRAYRLYGEKDLEVTFVEKEWNKIVQQMQIPRRDAESISMGFIGL